MSNINKYLFRGKELETGRWAYGSLDYNDVLNKAVIINYLRSIDRVDAPLEGGKQVREIDPKTTGQWTGYKDYEDKKIFEGDIVRIVNENEDESIHIVIFMQSDYPAFEIFPELGVESNSLMHAYCTDCRIYVIGNIHDNPEMFTRR